MDIEEVKSGVSNVWTSYLKNTPTKLKAIDVFLVYILLTGVFQVVYVILVGTFPYNSFLSGFISTVGSFILAVSLRIQTNKENTKLGGFSISPERAFVDFVLCHIVLHLAVFNFMG